MTTQSQDNELLQKLNNADQEAFLEVYDAYAEKIYRFVYYKVENRETAEDLSQTTFFKVWEYVSDSRGHIENIQAFLYQIARNLVFDHWRGKGKESLPLLEEVFKKIDDTPTLEERIDGYLDWQLARQALQKISENYKEVILMKYLEELSVEEISKVLKKDKNNVYVLIHRATAALKREIDKLSEVKTGKSKKGKLLPGRNEVKSKALRQAQGLN
jgi:RNA polymerase sigma-70 factor, ECF subfamily